MLEPHKTASFDVFGADFDAARDVACPKTAAAAIAPPHDASRIVVRLRIPDCGAFYVAPVVAGSTDRDSWSMVVR